MPHRNKLSKEDFFFEKKKQKTSNNFRPELARERPDLGKRTQADRGAQGGGNPGGAKTSADQTNPGISSSAANHLIIMQPHDPSGQLSGTLTNTSRQCRR
jgi:hypothetical protein